ncbi:tetratricopeptide repeat protein [Flindersiella endophytica]
MTSDSFSRPGAVDLSGLAKQAGVAPAGATGASGPGAGRTAGTGQYTIDVTDATFQKDVAERSLSVPVVIDFWADWCQPCKQLTPILEKLADEYAGRFVLARIDIDANQQIAQAMGIQSIPLVAAALRGQLVPLFQGAQPEAQVRAALEQLLQLAVANGVAGRSEPVAAGTGSEAADGAEEEQIDPRFAAAVDAIERGDLDSAAAEYQRVLDQTPADQEATAALAQVNLLRRARDIDPAEARAAAAAKPEDAQAQCNVADLELLDGQVVEAFNRLVETVRNTSGDERDAARLHLLDLFTVVGASDPRVRKARQQLSSALF